MYPTWDFGVTGYWRVLAQSGFQQRLEEASKNRDGNGNISGGDQNGEELGGRTI